jgi:hypothetical protein
MRVRGRCLSFADLADRLEQPSLCNAISTDFMLNQLHALIRVPFEILCDYCRDFDKSEPRRQRYQKMKLISWYEYARMNAISHNFHFQFSARDKLPVTWNGITLSKEMDGQPITYESLWQKRGYELFLAMRTFAKTLPEPQREERA